MKQTEQPDLFSIPARYPNAPGHRGVATSIKAAESIKPHMTRLQLTIARYLKTCGAHGAIYTEITERCDLSVPTVCGRMREMVLASPAWVRANGQTRTTPSGREARVYVLTQAGIDHLNKLDADRSAA